jgi:DNA-binding MarR family transcriptional regulator
MEPKDLLQEIVKTLNEINQKLERIANAQTQILESLERTESEESKKLPLDVDALLTLPDHLRRTAMAVGELESATADQIAAQTGRTRAAESDYLNQLVKMGYLQKERKGRTVFFSI